MEKNQNIQVPLEIEFPDDMNGTVDISVSLRVEIDFDAHKVSAEVSDLSYSEMRTQKEAQIENDEKPDGIEHESSNVLKTYPKEPTELNSTDEILSHLDKLLDYYSKIPTSDVHAIETQSEENNNVNIEETQEQTIQCKRCDSVKKRNFSPSSSNSMSKLSISDILDDDCMWFDLLFYDVSPFDIRLTKLAGCPDMRGEIPMKRFMHMRRNDVEAIIRKYFDRDYIPAVREVLFHLDEIPYFAEDEQLQNMTQQTQSDIKKSSAIIAKSLVNGNNEDVETKSRILSQECRKTSKKLMEIFNNENQSKVDGIRSQLVELQAIDKFCQFKFSTPFSL